MVSKLATSSISYLASAAGKVVLDLIHGAGFLASRPTWHLVVTKISHTRERTSFDVAIFSRSPF